MSNRQKSTSVLKPYELDEKKKKQASIVYGQKEAEHYGFILKRCEDAKTQRSQTLKEFDDLNYDDDYEFNSEAANSYLRRKKNDAEVRVRAGTAEKKVEVVLNELLNLKLGQEIHAYDQNDLEIEALGQQMSDIIDKTNTIEGDKYIRQSIILELLTQRAVFVKEVFVDKYVIDKKRFDKRSDVFGKPTKKKFRRIQRAEKKVICGKNIYLGDIEIPYYRFNEQPFVIEYERVHYETAKTIFGTWENWKYVKAGNGEQSWFSGSFDYRFGKRLKETEVEVIYYKSAVDDEYQVIINGVMMLPVGTALPYEYEGYDISMGILKSTGTNLAYGRSLLSSSKTLDALSSETIRLLIYKWQQAVKPPVGVKGKNRRVYSRNIWDPGAVTQGVEKNNFSTLIDHQGVTNSEMAMSRFIDEKTAEFIGTGNVDQGLAERGGATATEIRARRAQAIKLLGLAVLSYMKIIEDLTHLRKNNILENYTKPTGFKVNPVSNQVQKVFRNFTIKGAELANGKTGKKIISLIDRDINEEEQQEIRRFEDEQASNGENIEIKTINVNALRSLNAFWEVSIIRKEEDNSDLRQALFNEKLMAAHNISQITGVPINGAKAVQEFENTFKARGFFQVDAPIQQQQGQQQGQGQKQQAEQLLGQINQLKQTKVGQNAQQGVAAPSKLLQT